MNPEPQLLRSAARRFTLALGSLGKARRAVHADQARASGRRGRGGDRFPVQDVAHHLAPLGVGDAPPVDAITWCIELGSVLRTARSIVQAPRRRRRDRGEAERALATLRNLVAVLDRPVTGEAGEPGSSVAADSQRHECAFDFAVEDGAACVTYTPWTDGFSVGFKCAGAGHADEYLYLVPSDGHAGVGGLVAFHRGPAGVPGRDDVSHRYTVRTPGRQPERFVAAEPDAEPSRSSERQPRPA